MFLMEYTSMRGEDFQDDSKQATWKFLNGYIYAFIKRLIYEYLGDGLQAITRW